MTPELQHELRIKTEENGFVDRQVIRCVRCEIETALSPKYREGDCPHCGTRIASLGMRKMVRPFAAVPGKVSRKSALQRIRARGAVGRLWSNRPSRLQRSESNLRGLFLSYWLYDITTSTRYAGETSRGVAMCRLDNIIVEAGRSLGSTMDKLVPCDPARCEPLDPDLLEEWPLECPTVGLEQAFQAGLDSQKNRIRADVASSVEGRIESLDTHCREVRVRQVLLPVWISAACVGNRIFRLVVDAQDGEVYEDPPRELKL